MCLTTAKLTTRLIMGCCGQRLEPPLQSGAIAGKRKGEGAEKAFFESWPGRYCILISFCLHVLVYCGSDVPYENTHAGHIVYTSSHSGSSLVLSFLLTLNIGVCEMSA